MTKAVIIKDGVALIYFESMHASNILKANEKVSQCNCESFYNHDEGCPMLVHLKFDVIAKKIEFLLRPDADTNSISYEDFSKINSAIFEGLAEGFEMTANEYLAE